SHLTHYSHCRTPLHLSSNLFPYTTLFRSNQLGFVVRGIYGEGSEAIGNVFQVSNQITLGKTEEEIVLDLESVILKLMEAERKARSEEHTSELQSRFDLVCRLLLEKKKNKD